MSDQIWIPLRQKTSYEILETELAGVVRYTHTPLVFVTVVSRSLAGSG